MFFLALIIYLSLFVPANFFLYPLVLQSMSLPVIVLNLFLFAVSALMSVLLAFLVDGYITDMKVKVGNLVRLPGVRWFAALTGFAVTVLVLMQVFQFEGPAHPFFYGMLIPILAVSIVNMLGFEIPLKRLKDEESPQPDIQPDLPHSPDQVKPPPEMVKPPVVAPPEPPEPKVYALDDDDGGIPREAADDDENDSGEWSPPQYPPLTEAKDDIVFRKFQWNHEWNGTKTKYTITLPIRRNLYLELKNRGRIPDYSKWSEEYVSKGVTGEIRELAYQLYRRGMSFGTYQEVSLVLSFVQNVITYTSDVGEYPKYPLETLGDQNGDCEDFSILAAAILKCMGYEVALLYVPGHAALGVAGAAGLPGTFMEHNGIRYYYCETTGKDWKIGQLPEDFKNAGGSVSPVPPLPMKIVRSPKAGEAA